MAVKVTKAEMDFEISETDASADRKHRPSCDWRLKNSWLQRGVNCENRLRLRRPR